MADDEEEARSMDDEFLKSKKSSNVDPDNSSIDDEAPGPASPEILMETKTTESSTITEASSGTTVLLEEPTNRSASVVSEASTVVRHNLSSRRLIHKPTTVESSVCAAAAAGTAAEKSDLLEGNNLAGTNNEESPRTVATSNPSSNPPTVVVDDGDGDDEGHEFLGVSPQSRNAMFPSTTGDRVAKQRASLEDGTHPQLQLTSTTLEDLSRLDPPTTDNDDRFGMRTLRNHPPSHLLQGGPGSEVLSTASEMGTVIEAPSSASTAAWEDPRLAQLSSLLLDDDPIVPDKDAASCTPPRGGGAATSDRRKSYHYDAIFGSTAGIVSSDLDEEEEDDDDLALPLLDGKFHHDEKKTTDTPRHHHALHPSSTFSASQESPGGKSMLSRTMSRLAHTLVASAPSTPRELPRTSAFSPSRRTVVARNAGGAIDDAAAEVTPSSFLLRSPGSSAHVRARQYQRRDSTTPSRVAALQDSLFPPGNSSPPRRSQTDHQSRQLATATQPPQPQWGNHTYRHIMTRACFSYDAYDTCDDRVYEFPLDGGTGHDDTDRLLFLSPLQLLQSPVNLGPRDGTVDRRQHAPSVEVSGEVVDGRWNGRKPAGQSLLWSSRSWEVDHSPRNGDWSAANPINPIRTTSFLKSANRIVRTKQPTTTSGAFPKTTPDLGLVSPPRASKAYRNSTPRTLSPKRRILPSLDDLELRSPQRLDVEREDALDILSCLVERGVRFKGVDRVLDSIPQEQMDVSAAVQVLKKLARSTDCGDTSMRDTCLRALDEMVASHEYAHEMRRASLSASSWLRSIGRTSADTPSQNDPPQFDLQQDPAGTIDLLTARAMLHSTRMELEEKSKVASRLDAELAKCRAEIGRLRSSNSIGASFNSSFRSPNRSILDESDDLSTGETEVENELDQSFGGRSPIPDKDDSHCLDTSFEDLVPLHQDEGDIAKFQAALEEANVLIRKLHARVKELSEARIDGSMEDDPPIVKVSVATKVDLMATCRSEPVRKDQLDCENYVTDWDELQPSLPPPPDHGLHSPIVATVLEQWSSDVSLQQCLLSWMEQVLSGADLLNVPPLTLTSLSHQVRDGFVTHVLPLLLRRPDLSVDVKVRAQKVTTYDLAVSVEPITATSAPVPFLSSGMPWRQQLETIAVHSEAGGAAGSATHSAVTAMISNSKLVSHDSMLPHDGLPQFIGHSTRSSGGGPASSRLSYDEVADSVEAQPPPGIMSALGGALGFLARRKAQPIGPGGAESLTPSFGEATLSEVVPTPSSPAHFTFSEQDDDDAQPYHRVLAAPPGRLGMTIVEYRGHAMVSAVSTDSPLVGWIFPSDILIAIDELPISGMRVRDIIQILKDRQGRQRALRVISSHNMTELTMSNTSALMNDSS